MPLPMNLEEYNQRCKANMQISGRYSDTTIHMPCLFCGAAEFMVYKILEMKPVCSVGATCKECGRAAKAIFSGDAHSAQFEFVQTVGDDPPEWLPIPIRRFDGERAQQGLREAAEKNRRGIEILKEKSEQHGASVCTISGKPPDPDYAELGAAPQPIDPRSKQHLDYYVLCPEERAKGFARPVRRTYIHVGKPPDGESFEYPITKTFPGGCGTRTSMGVALAETYARDPHFYSHTFCCTCQDHFPVDQFVWEGTTE